MQIKVTDTRMHTIYTMGIKEGITVPVVEAKLVLVKTDSLNYLWKGSNQYYFADRLERDGNNYEPILISETERIEVGDWRLSGVTGSVLKTTSAEVSLLGKGTVDKKILALPEHFSPKHLQDIVNGKLKDGDKVLVECVIEDLTADDEIEKSYERKFIKLNSLNHITLHKMEKDWSEAREVIEKSLGTFTNDMIREQAQWVIDGLNKAYPNPALYKTEEKMYRGE